MSSKYWTEKNGSLLCKYKQTISFNQGKLVLAMLLAMQGQHVWIKRSKQMANAHLLQLSKLLLLTSYSFKKELLHCLKQKQRKTRCFCKTNMCKIKVKESKNKQINKQKQANGNGIKRKIKEKKFGRSKIKTVAENFF